MKMFKIEEKYLVLKREDLERFFAQYQRGIFATEEEQKTIAEVPFIYVLEQVRNIRLQGHKNPDPKYWVCNQDEPYSDMIIRLIELGENAKPKPISQVII
jgi:hypothetical protein